MVKAHGEEFYNEKNNVIVHGGDIPTDSAWFYCSLENDTSVCILSDQGATARNLFKELLMQTAWFKPVLEAKQANQKQDKTEQDNNRPEPPSHAYELHVQQSNTPPPTMNQPSSNADAAVSTTNKSTKLKNE